MRRMTCYISSLILVMMLLIPGTASAASLFEHQDTVVPSEQTVDDVYVVGGDAEIQGHVTGIIVVVNGNLHLTNTARVEGMIVVVGGTVDQESGAFLGDDLYNLSLDDATQNSLLIGGGLMALMWVLQLGGSLILILIPVLIRVIGREKTREFIERFSVRAWGRLLFTGFLIGVALTAISALLLVSIVGIPLIIVVLIAIAIATLAGITVISYHVGNQVQGVADKPDWIKIMVGSIVIAAVANIPIVGWCVLLIVILVALGISLDWLGGKFRRKKRKG
ncbi:hypothetical protein DFQ01_10616 [Paenibacillus cellulosilyticus]|uniref:Polymer-forming protein n=1 Tax=Paenibacillus cellulosilyticus TaxID=375489 RepID=A0A2V2YUH4_9BACL|nr:hypothetical protein [Paenibacillus cellulosilyticus]PWW04735.1 hypothetical protein DFQ01_10616 [Paenibacillus cellulosilyticus]QKS45860.1 hypothetical protein HUB94_16485 [Paenibacillus cellulosilyticus]